MIIKTRIKSESYPEIETCQCSESFMIIKTRIKSESLLVIKQRDTSEPFIRQSNKVDHSRL